LLQAGRAGYDAADHRAETLSLTRKGAEAAQAARNALVALDADSFAGYTWAQLEAAVRLLNALAQARRGSSLSGDKR
jgi:DNA-binding MarR family transcriptional regulator